MPISEDTLVKVLISDRAKVLAYLRFVTRDADLADDVFQELSLYALKKRGTIQDTAHLYRWLRKVGRNLAIKALMRERQSPVRVNSELLDLVEQEWAQFDAQPTNEMTAMLRQCIEGLAPYPKKLVEMRYVHGLTGINLARSLGRRHANTVSVALTRVHRALSNCVRQRMAWRAGRS